MAVEDDGTELAVPGRWYNAELARLVTVADWGVGDPFASSEAGGWFWLYVGLIGGREVRRRSMGGFIVDAKGGGAGELGISACWKID